MKNTQKLSKYFNEDVSKIWRTKYHPEKTPGELWKEMAKLASEVEEPNKQKEWEDNFNDILQDFKFIPGGRILYGLNESIKDPQKKIGLSNCFVVPAPNDSIESIFDTAKILARIYSRGGGCGVSLDKIRPKGAIVNNSAERSDGVVPFMKIFSSVTENISINGRRGALLLTLSVDHPDIIEFINSKCDLKDITAANISVRLTDDFMKAVINDEMWNLTFHVKSTGEKIDRSLPANEIFDLFIKNSNATGEPGGVYWDKVEKFSPNYHFPNHRVAGQNPCSEETLPEFGACLLGSVVLSKFVKYGLTKRAEVDWDSLRLHLQHGLRFLDNVIDLQIKYKLYPHNEQLKIAQSGRQSGLGITGLHDYLILQGKRIDSEDGLAAVDKLSEFITDVVYSYGMDIAKEKGAFPDWDYDLWMKSDFVKSLPSHLHEKAKECGVRNISMMSFAPTGSLSIIAGSSSGIEPIFQKSYDRIVKLGGAEKIIKVLHPLYERYLEKNYDIDESVFVTSHEISWEKRIRLQAILQRRLDTAISSCLTLENHMINTDKGLKYIEDVVNPGDNNTFTGINGEYITLNHNNEKSKITDGYINGIADTYKVEFSKGNNIIGTKNHKLQILTNNYDTKWVEIGDIQNGDYVVGRMNLGCFGNSQTCISKINGKFESKIKDVMHGNTKKIKLPGRVTTKFARLLGYLISDGCVNDNGITLSQLNNNVVSDFTNLVKELFDIDVYVYRDKRVSDNELLSVSANSRILRDFIEYIGITRSAFTKTIPKVIFEGAGRTQTAEFIKGLTLDGFVSKDKLGVMTTISKKLANELILLLNQFGIIANIMCNPEGERKFPQGGIYETKESFSVYVTGYSAYKFIKNIGFAEDRKNKEAKEKFKTQQYFRNELFGNIPDYGIMENIRDKCLPHINSNKLYSELHSYTNRSNYTRSVERSQIQYFKDLNILIDIPDYIMDPTYRFMEVKDVTYNGKKETLDVSVDNGHSYIVNNLISHNTINLPSDTTDETVRNIYIEAWKQGLKGITVYRDGSRSGILIRKKKRPAVLESKTYQIKSEEVTYYVTISDNMDQGELKKKPFEIFINSQKPNDLIGVVTRLMSAIMRRTDDVSFIVRQLRKSANGHGGDFLKKLANVIEEHIGKKKVIDIQHIAVSPISISRPRVSGFQECPSCKQMTLVMENGCNSCKNPSCGYGACGI